MDRLEVIVRFLAVLELFKQGRCDLEQPRSFGDIEISWLDRPRHRRGSERASSISVDAYDG